MSEPGTNPPASQDDAADSGSRRGLALRSLLGGTLMGLANLVPGISGGTMLLAAGVYPQFVSGVAEVSTFRFRLRTIFTLACIVGAALVAVVTLAGPVSHLVIDHRWMMYALFIGLTLGGVPVLWQMIKPVDGIVIAFCIAGIAVMALMAWIGPSDGGQAAGDARPYLLYFLAGVAGASAMVLPGISGGYLLLLLGQYVAILSAVAMLKDGAKDRDWALVAEAMHVVIPVGLGVVIGVVGVSNLVKWLLARVERPTLGTLLGLLLGAVIGLWPFQEGVPPAVGSTFRGDTVATQPDGTLIMASTGKVIEPDKFVTEFFSPTPGQVAAVLGLIALGFAASWGVSHLGGTGRKQRS